MVLAASVDVLLQEMPVVNTYVHTSANLKRDLSYAVCWFHSSRVSIAGVSLSPIAGCCCASFTVVAPLFFFFFRVDCCCGIENAAVKVHFQPIANAPILRKSKFHANAAWTCSEVRNGNAQLPLPLGSCAAPTML